MIGKTDAIGTTYAVAPIPPDPAHTIWVEIGAMRIGVESRLLDDAALAANYSGDDLAEIEEAVGDGAIDDNGVSIHIEGVHDRHEYLRFDMFDHDPHYHYIHRSGESQTIVQFDRVAFGAMPGWVMTLLRDGTRGEGGRLRAMLAEVGGEHLLDDVDPVALAERLLEVERLAGEAAAALAAGSRGAPRGRG